MPYARACNKSFPKHPGPITQRCSSSLLALDMKLPSFLPHLPQALACASILLGLAITEYVYQMSYISAIVCEDPDVEIVWDDDIAKRHKK